MTMRKTENVTSSIKRDIQGELEPCKIVYLRFEIFVFNEFTVSFENISKNNHTLGGQRKINFLKNIYRNSNCNDIDHGSAKKSSF